MDEQNPDQSVQEWIARARRARELVDWVGFDEVAGHDLQAVEKLAKVTEALSELSEGRNVEYIPGVDEDEAPVMDAEQLRHSEMMTALSDAGLAEQLGRVFIHGDTSETIVIDLIPHRDGLPEFEVCLAPDHSPAEGAHGIFIPNGGCSPR